MNYSQVGLVIAVTRIRSGISQEELARRSGISQADICKLESGKHNTTVKTLKRLAAAMGKRLDISFVD